MSHSGTDFSLPCGIQGELQFPPLLTAVSENYYIQKNKPDNLSQIEKKTNKTKSKQSKIILSELAQFDFASQSLTFHCKRIHMGNFFQPNS